MFGEKKQNTVSEEDVLNTLKKIQNPLTNRDIVSDNLVSDIRLLEENHALITLTVDAAHGTQMEALRQDVEKTVRSYFSIEKVTAVLTAEQKPMAQGNAPDPHGMNKNPPLTLPIKNIIAVASGKGGVGKSMIAANLAYSLAQAGHTTALLDADIYGPSVPKLTGIEGQKPKTDKNQNIIPLESQGLNVMSIGFMIEGYTPLIWRGPMVQSAIYQMLRDVNWTANINGDELDYLIVDMPPGTGDAQLTMAQKVPLTGALIVSTPQDIALIDAVKAVEMFRKTGVPILGLIENMSLYCCPQCGHEEHIFGHGGAREATKEMNVEFLGEMYLSKEIRIRSDEGKLFGLPPEIMQKILT